MAGWSERDLRRWRWVLLGAWLVLIISLLVPGSAPRHGLRLFWGSVVPGSLLLIAVLSHDLWRRLCPLAFVSQLGRGLGLQRTRIGRSGRPEVVKVEGESWLARHHIALQWSLLIVGLSLRLLLFNHHPIALALLLSGTLLAAVLVGWAFGGKAWCHYVCPMGPVQTVLTGLRGPLGRPAHTGSRSRLTQSMCRTIAADGREQSACVGCQAPCFDIDAERSFWQTLRSKRGLGWAWYSYPGLVLAFFLQQPALGSLAQAWRSPLDPPLLLAAGALLSALLFRALEGLLRRRHAGLGPAGAEERAVLQARLLASFLAVNALFWCVDPLQGLFGSHGAQILRSLVLISSSIALHRSWQRDHATYRRESTGESLRRQLRALPGLEAALDGRALEALTPGEVFTLVNALPEINRQQARQLYSGVMTDLLRTGRLTRAGVWLELQELRQTLKLAEDDHHAVVRQLAAEHPQLLTGDLFQRQIDDLRREAAEEGLEELMRLAGQDVLDRSRWPADLQQRLERLQFDCGLDDDDWRALEAQFGPRGERERQRLRRRRQDWLEEAALEALLAERMLSDPLLRPLQRALNLRADEGRSQLEARLAAAGLEPLPARVDPAGRLEQAFDRLWRDADPDTAGWVLMLERERHPERVAARLQDPRAGLGDSPFLQAQRQGLLCPERQELPALASCGLFVDLLPAGLLWLARQGTLRHFGPGEVVMRMGEVSDSLALVVAGEVQLDTRRGRSVRLGIGQSVGEVGLITALPRMATALAGPDGASLFVLPAEVFEEMLQRSWSFSRGLLGQLAQRLVGSAPPPPSP
ncbi:MAG: hypothetical protein RLZZ124_1149 [Cyanobacteriota bacterium]